MVDKVGTVPSEVVRRAVEQIEPVKGRVLDVVLNRVNPDPAGSASLVVRDSQEVSCFIPC